MKRIIPFLFLAVAACGTASESDLSVQSARSSASDSGRTLFVQSAREHADGTVTLPLYRGTSRGRTVWYIVLDSSSGDDAQAKGVNRSQKLANTTATAQLSI